MSVAVDAPAPPEPTNRRTHRRRRLAVWIVIALIVIGAVIAAVATSSTSARVRLGPDDASPVGSKALVQVLRDQGARVRATESLAATRRAVDDPSDTTIVVYDEDGILTPGRLRRLDGLADRIVLLDPTFDALDTLAPGVGFRGEGSGTASGCRVGGLVAEDRVRADGTRFVAAAAENARSCLGTRDRGYALVQVPGPSTAEVDVVGNISAFENQHVIERADGAYALGILGRSAEVVWYLPGDADLPTSPGDVPLVPSWYSPVIVLLIVVALAAILWRARRFGPLAIENLPVVVPASETMEGRARLYARSSARLRALDALRVGAIQRMARDCGLPRVASVAEVVESVSAATGRPRDAVASVLIDAQPAADADLMRLTASLVELERQTHAATRGR